MNTSKIINRKSVAIIVGFIAGIYIIDLFESGWNHITLLLGIGWLFAGALTWAKQFWGTVILLLLTVHNLVFYTLFDILNFKSSVEYFSSRIDYLSHSTIRNIIIILMSLETIILLCIIYYAITVIRRKKVY